MDSLESELQELKELRDRAARNIELAWSERDRLRSYADIGVELMHTGYSKAEWQNALLEAKIELIGQNILRLAQLREECNSSITMTQAIQTVLVKQPEASEIFYKIIQVMKRADPVLQEKRQMRATLSLQCAHDAEMADMEFERMLTTELHLPVDDVQALIRRYMENPYFNPVVEVVVCREYDRLRR